MNLFLPDSGLVIWMLIAFSILFFILAKFAWPVILGGIKTREDHISGSLAKADEAIKTLSGLEQKGRDIIATAQQEQMRMVKETKEMNLKMLDDAKSEAKMQAAKIIEEAQEQIRKDKDHAIVEVRKEIAKLSIGIAEKVIRKQLEDKKEQTSYIERLLEETEKSAS